MPEKNIMALQYFQSKTLEFLSRGVPAKIAAARDVISRAPRIPDAEQVKAGLRLLQFAECPGTNTRNLSAFDEGLGSSETTRGKSRYLPSPEHSRHAVRWVRRSTHSNPPIRLQSNHHDWRAGCSGRDRSPRISSAGIPSRARRLVVSVSAPVSRRVGGCLRGSSCAVMPANTFLADSEDVAALQRAGQLHVREFAEFFQRRRDRGRFFSARFGAQRDRSRRFVRHHRGVLHKHRIGSSGSSGREMTRAPSFA